ncbi:MAG: YHS domain-containing protein [Acidobacteria bacterium]|nr:YHS domain-containing protein [Acidobacteriota bacterium]
MIWLLRLAALLAAFFFLRWFWQSAWRRLSGHPPSGRGAEPDVRHGIIRQDPVCGTYVDVEVSVREEAQGETLHFCSERCRDAFRLRQSRRVQPTG